MLSSHIAAVSRTNNSSSLVHRRVAGTVIRPSVVTLGRAPRTHQQSRAFRLGLWTSNLDPSCQKEFQRHRRSLQRKYIQAVNRKLAWDGGSRSAYLKHSDLKGFMTSTWRGHVMRPASRWVDLNSWHSASSRSQPTNSSGIEEVERNALDKLFDHKDAVNDYVRAGSQMLERGWNTLLMSEHKLTDNFKDLSQTLHKARKHHHTTEKPSQTRFTSHNGQGFEYEIDPITNRKVFKNAMSGSAKSDSKSTEIPVKKFNGYQSQFVEFMPPSINGSGVSTGETGKPNKVDMSVFDMPATREPLFEEYHGTVPDSYKPFRFNEPDGKPPKEVNSVKTIHECLMDYERRFPNCYEAFRYNEPDGKAPEKPSPVEESLKEYDSISNGYKAFRYNEPDGKAPEQPSPVEKFLKEYDMASNGYKAFRYNEPDGKAPERPSPVEEALKEYDLASDGYKAFRYNEPDGKPPAERDPMAESLNEYDSQAKDAYKPFRYNEPDGKPPQKEDIMARSLSEYENSIEDAYKPFRYNEPDGKPAEKIDPLKESLKDYEVSSEGYKPFKYNEPDGKPTEKPDTLKESLKGYETSSQGYKAFRYNEPDGKPAEQPDPLKESLNHYELSSKGYQPFRYNEPDGKPAEQSDPLKESLKNYELSSEGYKPFKYNEPDGKPAERPDPLKESLKDYEIFSEGYKPFKYNEPDGQPLVHPDIVENELSNFDKGNTTSYSSSYGTTDSSSRLYQPFDSTMDPQFNSFDYSSVRNKVEGLDSLQSSNVQTSSEFNNGPQQTIADENQARRRELEKDFLKTHSVTFGEPEESAAIEKIKSTKKLSQDVKAEYNDLNASISAARSRIDAKLAEIGETSNTGSGKQRLTGNFIHDFPEEFKSSWTSKGADGSLIPEKSRENNVQKAERTYVDGMAPPSSFSRNPGAPRLETSLDRSNAKGSNARIDKAQIQTDPYSKEPQGLETAYDEECGNGQPVYMSSYEAQDSGKTASTDGSSDITEPAESKNMQKRRDKTLRRELTDIYEKSYGKIDINHRQAADSPVVAAVESKAENVDGVNKNASTTPAQPSIYKILAYDPATQSISSAETTSVVPDLSAPLTPAEVLLRLSNPTKFLPHFEPLKQKGFEIVSGSGNVLVFRKVRDTAPPTPQATLTGENKRAKMRVTNPIDGMTTRAIPATGNFASPTGFVNHDLPLDPAEYDPPFKSNIDVRREEPVFSGKSSWTDGTEGSQRAKGGKRRMKKVLIGATWVAGCTYAVGVVAEFFKTGGIDGKGPVGF